MKYFIAIITLTAVAGSASAQLGRGGRGGAPAPRPNIQRPSTPQVQRPSFSPPPMQRPATPNIQRPTAPSMPNIQRPTAPAMPKPSMPSLPTTRPTMPQVPSVKPGLVPSQPQRPNLNLPERPTTLPGNVTRPNLPDRPSTLPGNVTRPNLPERPTILPGNVTRPNLPERPTTLPEVRPNLPNVNPDRPGTRPNLPENPVTKPWLPPRPGTGGSGVLQPGVLPNRPPINNGNINNGNIINNRPNINNGFNNNTVNNNNNYNFNKIAPSIYNPYRPYGGYFKPYYGNVYRPYGWANYGNTHIWGNYYCQHYYHHWHGGYWNNYFPFAPGFIPRPVPFGWFLPPTVSMVYYNPYYIVPPSTTPVIINYSQPLPVESTQPVDPPVETPVPNQAPAAPQKEDPNAKAAAEIFDKAREQFKKGAYAGAQATIEKAIEKLPQDPTLHEFRALCYFAQGQYIDAAGAVYAVLGAGPGWNSETLYSMYDNPEIYKLQLGNLEGFAAKNPNAGYAQFLLGYEYLTIGDKPKAITAFQNAAKLDPKDELSANLVKMLVEGDKQP